MRALLGPILVHGALLAAGFGVLRVVGTVGSLRSRRALAAAGLAYLVGIASTLTACLILLVVGVGVNIAVIAGVALLLASPVLWWRRGVSGGSGGSRVPGRGLERLAVITLIVALCALAIVGLLAVGNRPLDMIGVDGWNQWTRKALLLFYSPHLPSAVFSFSGTYRYETHYDINPNYPLLLPLLYATHLRALGRPDPSSVHTVLWLLAIAFVWAGGFIASRVTAAIVWAPVLAGAVMLTIPRLMSAYADIPLGYFLALGTLQTGVWLQSRKRADLAIATLLLAGAAQIKDEGTVGALIVLAAAIAFSVVRRERAREPVIAAGLLVIVAVLPWQLWVGAHNIPTTNPLGRVLDPGYLVNNAGRVGPAVGSLVSRMTSPESVTAFIAIALAMVLVAFWERRRRSLAAFYLLVGVGYLIGLVWSFWTSILPEALLERTGAPRVVLPLGLLCVAAVLHLSADEP